MVAIMMAFFVLTNRILLVQLGRYDRYLARFKWFYITWLLEMVLILAVRIYYLVSGNYSLTRQLSHPSPCLSVHLLPGQQCELSVEAWDRGEVPGQSGGSSSSECYVTVLREY